MVVCHPDPHSFNHALANEVLKQVAAVGDVIAVGSEIAIVEM
jgi:putative NADPH-quinone reductase